MENSKQSAFPRGFQDNQPLQTFGLTKREYFAGLAMQGLMANPHAIEWSEKQICMFSLTHADELLKQLETTNPKPNE